MRIFVSMCSVYEYVVPAATYCSGSPHKMQYVQIPRSVRQTVKRSSSNKNDANQQGSPKKSVGRIYFQPIQVILIPSRELTYTPKNGILKMIFLFPRWDMLVPRRVVLDELGYFCATRHGVYGAGQPSAGLHSAQELHI